jgi:hypothetical protein
LYSQVMHAVMSLVAVETRHTQMDRHGYRCQQGKRTRSELSRSHTFFWSLFFSRSLAVLTLKIRLLQAVCQQQQAMGSVVAMEVRSLRVRLREAAFQHGGWSPRPLLDPPRATTLQCLAHLSHLQSSAS